MYQSREHRQARERLVAAAVGSRCPGSRLLLTAANAQADHVTARALGGGSPTVNLRVPCGACNHNRGSSLGGRVTAARRCGRVTRRNVAGRFQGAGPASEPSGCDPLSADRALPQSVSLASLLFLSTLRMADVVVRLRPDQVERVDERAASELRSRVEHGAAACR